MEENTTIDIAQSGFADFEAAFNGDDGYQTEEPAGTTEDQTEAADAGSEPADDAAEPAGEGVEADDQEEGEEENPPAQEESFTLRVNQEDRVVSREEMFSLAQKGADYDRVKGQLAESRQSMAQMQEQLDKNQSVLDVLEMIAEETKQPVEQLLDQLHVNLRMKNGETEAEAKANIRALKLEKQVSSMQSRSPAQKEEKSDGKARAEKEVAEFHNRFPGVELTEDLCKELMPDVQKGTSLADAYQNREMARKDAEIAELRKKMAASEQNKKNRAKSPGSQNDSGGRRTRSEEDDFFAAFEK